MIGKGLNHHVHQVTNGIPRMSNTHMCQKRFAESCQGKNDRRKLTDAKALNLVTNAQSSLNLHQ